MKQATRAKEGIAQKKEENEGEAFDRWLAWTGYQFFRHGQFDFWLKATFDQIRALMDERAEKVKDQNAMLETHRQACETHRSESRVRYVFELEQ